MKQTLFLIVLSICLTLAVNISAQDGIPVAGKPKDFVLPKSKKIQLPNGFRATMVPYGNMPKLNVLAVVKTGQVHEKANEKWLARFTGKLMEEGSKKTDFETLSKKVAAMGGRLSVNVGMETITIGGSVLSEYGPEFIALIAEILTDPSFPAHSGDRLKNDLKRDLSVKKAQPDAQASEKFFTIIYKDHPYSTKLPTDEMLNSFTVEKARTFYRSNFGAQRTTLYVAGKFDEQGVSKSINDHFSSWAKGPAVNYPTATASRTNEIATIERPDAPQTVILLGTPVAEVRSPDYTQLDVTNSLLGGSFGSRITTNIREEKGYTYSPYSTIQNRQKIGVWYEKADVTSEHTAASLNEIAKEIRQLQATPPDAKELKGIQNYEAGSFVLNNSSTDGIISQLNFMDMHGLQENYLTNRIRDIYSVTPAQVQAIAKKYLDYDKMTLVLLGDKKQLETQMQEIKKTKSAKKSF
jgi:zinc protease